MFFGRVLQPYGTNQASKLKPCTKKVNGLQSKTISAKNSTLDV